MARVTIGVPVHNGGAQFELVLQNILSQSYADLVVIISDNASDDDTSRLCLEVLGDERVKYLRHNELMSAVENFEVVRRLAETEFFMWWAADDFRSSNFVEACVELLDRNPNVVAASGFDRMKGSERSFDLIGTAGNKASNLLTNIYRSHGVFYSLHRRLLTSEFSFSEGNHFFARDWAFDLLLLSKGDFMRAPQALAVFGSSGSSNRDVKEFFAEYRVSYWNYFFPLETVFKTAYYLRKSYKPKERVKIFYKLFKINLKLAFLQLTGR